MRVLLVYPNLNMMLIPSTAIGLFTAILKADGFEVDVFDTTRYEHPLTVKSAVSAEKRVETLQYRPFNPETDILWKSIPAENLITDFVEKIDQFRPDLILVSVVEDTFKQALFLVDSIANQNIPTVFGGVFITAAPELAISFPQVNMIGIGEGEHIIRSVANSLRDGKTLDNIPGLWIKKPDGSIVRNAPIELVNIDEVIHDYSLFDDERFLRPMGGRIYKTLPVETIRGCTYKCAYCNSPMHVRFSRDTDLGHFVRIKSTEAIRESLENLIESHQPEYIYIIDDNFLARPKKDLEKFIDMYSDFKLPFWFNTRPETVDSQYLSALKDVGLDRISIGLEHGNFEYRKHVLNRNPTNEKLLKFFDVISDSEVAFSVNVIIGFPDETREMVFETIEFCRQIRGFDTLTISIFTPYHGTELRDLAVRRGYLDPSTLTSHTTSSSILDMPDFTSEQIDGMLRTFLMYVRFDKDLWQQIELAESFSEEGNRVWKELYDLYVKRFYQVDQYGDPV